MYKTLLDALESHVEKRGDTIFTRHLVSDAAEELTFRQFHARAADFATHYHAAGIQKGEVVLIFLKASPDVLPAFVGAMMVGAVPSLMPLPSAKQHPSIYWPNHNKLLERIAPRALLTDREHATQMEAHGMGAEGRMILAIEDMSGQRVSAPPIDIGGSDIALLQHSSGTTALKKGVALSHDSILRQAASYAMRLGATADDGIVSWLPIYHDMGLIACSMVPLVLGQTITVLDPFQWVGRPATLFDAITKYDARFVWMPNFAFEHMTRTVPRDYQGDLSHIRAFINCSEPCKTDTFDRFAERFAGIGVRREHLHVCYAMAETVFAVTQTIPGKRVGSLSIDRDALQQRGIAKDAVGSGSALTVLSNGQEIDGIVVTIRDGERILEENWVGEIVVSGSFLFDGYRNDPDTTASHLIDGWYHTRDRGFLRDSELYVLGRTDDLMIVGGRNLHAHEVEDIVATIPGLKAGRAVAFGVYNTKNATEELVIVAEHDDSGIDPEAIGVSVRETVFDKTNIDVKDIVIVEPGWLVKTTSGKISRESNKQRYLERTESKQVTPARLRPGRDDPGSIQDVAKIIARVFRCRPANIRRTTVATDIAGWDSLAHSTLILEIEQELGVAFNDREVFEFDNVGKLADRVAELRKAGGQKSHRIAFENDDFSIVVMGEGGERPDVVIFAGAASNFGGQNLMDFASTFQGTIIAKRRQIYVTDRRRKWFVGCFDQIANEINRISDGRKVLIGNSMGGYGVLMVAPLLANVDGILAFAPQSYPKQRALRRVVGNTDDLRVQPALGIPTFILFGEVDDQVHKSWIAEAFPDPVFHRIAFLNNCGHNVVTYLSEKGLLQDILLKSLDTKTMFEEITRIIDSVAPSKEELMVRVDLQLRRLKKHAGDPAKADRVERLTAEARQIQDYVAKKYPD